MNILEGTEQVIQSNVLLFGKYEMTGIGIKDGGLAKYIHLLFITVPHTGGKHANRSFAKSKMSIVERLINNLMEDRGLHGQEDQGLWRGQGCVRYNR